MPISTPSSGRGVNVMLWIAQVLVSVTFIAAGYVKFATPIPELAKLIPWTGQLPVAFVRFIGLVDFTGGIGILVPALTRIKPRLTVLAALGCTVLQILATIFHLSRGEANVTPLNFVLLTLSVFVLWGRRKKAPILPRGALA
jgi:uncharacterized membrane protein